jgi:hypothetical protein
MVSIGKPYSETLKFSLLILAFQPGVLGLGESGKAHSAWLIGLKIDLLGGNGFLTEGNALPKRTVLALSLTRGFWSVY